MKIQSTLVIVAVALFASGTVSGEWLKVSPGNSFHDYCADGGSKLDVPHACFACRPSFLKKITPDSKFRGYLRPDNGGFALLYDSDGTQLKTATHEIDVSLPAGAKCPSVLLHNIAGNSGSGELRDLCGADYWDLPFYMY
ncbi:uncharacterized protein SRS1_13522 [Sporisorium reilianum f. sp. reilianum]|uniref:Mig1 protein n=1 Tax=Sporisorium reilianum f. sp. reilianum TaxID=72559 RepID=A0A2N8UMJ7_9BASI|nr:uncharacterized protein SRS1_13522 [Sporisorium reilianum f. sp. reilianum]